MSVVPEEVRRWRQILDLELQGIVSSLAWMLGTCLKSFERAVSVHNC